MTKQEYNKCEKLLNEAIRNGIKAKDILAKVDKTKSKQNSEAFQLCQQAQNYLGYAEGINQCLACLGFNHERMSELQKLL